MERIQQRRDSGLISRRFPEVSTIVVDMKQYCKGISGTLLLRTLNFSSDSHAYFHIECLNKDCKDCTEGFDLEQVVAAMVRSHATSREGELNCKGNALTSGHVKISYKVRIQYNGGT